MKCLSLLSLLALASIGSATTVYSLRNDFTTAANPTGPWSYGWKVGTTGTFNLFTQFGSTTGTNQGWYVAIGGAPEPSVVRYTLTSYGAVAGEIALHGGPNGQIAVARWTAPTAGIVSLSAIFGVGNFGSVDHYVYLNGTSLFASLNQSGSNSFSQGGLTVAAGDTVDFMVGTAGSYQGDTTPVEGRIEFTPLNPAPVIPGPAAAVAFVAGAVGNLRRRRRKAAVR